MTRYKVVRPNQETRLRKWGAARLNQLRLMISHLEAATNNALAGQVLQSNKRKFSEFVPKIVTQDIETGVSYREIRVRFETPKGLRKFLFYEMQQSEFLNFAQFESFDAPEPHFTFSALEPGIEYFFRIRVVTTDGEVGPWSETLSQTALRARASATFRTAQQILISAKSTIDPDPFVTLFSVTHTSIGGQLFYMVDYEVRAGADQNTTHNISWTDLEFRWLEDGKQIGPTFLVTNYGMRRAGGGLSDDIVATKSNFGAFTLNGPFRTIRRGTFSQKIHSSIDGDITIELQLRQNSQHSTRTNDWTFNLDSGESIVKFNRGFIVQTKNLSVFEFFVDA